MNLLPKFAIYGIRSSHKTKEVSMEIKKGYTRVSEILAQWNSYSHIEPEVLKKAADRGRMVHEAIEANLNGYPLPLGVKEAFYLLSFVKWKETGRKEFCHSETRFYCDKLMITGCIDGLIKFPGSDNLVIIDYKTTAAENPKLWPLQGAFYRYLAEANGYELSTRMIFIKLDKQGEMPKLFEYTYDSKMLNICMAALTTYRYMKSDGHK